MNWSRIRELFDAATQLDPGARESFLRTACEGDPELLRQVRTLIEEDSRGGQPVDRSALDVLRREFDARPPDTVEER